MNKLQVFGDLHSKFRIVSLHLEHITYLHIFSPLLEKYCLYNQIIQEILEIIYQDYISRNYISEWND